MSRVAPSNTAWQQTDESDGYGSQIRLPLHFTVTWLTVATFLMGVIALLLSPFGSVHPVPALAQTPPTPPDPPKPERDQPQPDTPANQGKLGTFKSITYRPPQTRAIARTSGAGRRSQCQPPIVLEPGSHLGLTTTGHPTFFFYVADARPVHFVLAAEGAPAAIYETTVPVTKAGIVPITVPASAPELAVGKEYFWAIVLFCQQRFSDGDPFAQSWIQRVEPAARLAKSLTTVVSSERPALYAEHGIWYDTLTSLATLRRTYPNDPRLPQAWAALLKSVGLTAVADKPFADSALTPVELPRNAPAGIRSPEARPSALPVPVMPSPSPSPSPPGGAPAGVRSPETRPVPLPAPLPVPIMPSPSPTPSPNGSAPAGVRSPEARPSGSGLPGSREPGGTR